MTWLTLHQVAKELHICWSTARGLEAKGLKVVKLGKTAKSWRVDPSDLAEYIMRQKTCQSENEKTERILSKPTSLDGVLAEAREHLKKQKRLSKPPEWTHRPNGPVGLKKLFPNT